MIIVDEARIFKVYWSKNHVSSAESIFRFHDFDFTAEERAKSPNLVSSSVPPLYIQLRKVRVIWKQEISLYFPSLSVDLCSFA